MTRETSIEAYKKIKENGLLSQRRFEVYETVALNGPMTSAEAFQIMNHLKPTRNITQSRARFTELRQMGVFREVRTRECKVTGNTVIEWGITNSLPKEIEKKLENLCLFCNGTGYTNIEGKK